MLWTELCVFFPKLYIEVLTPNGMVFGLGEYGGRGSLGSRIEATSQPWFCNCGR